MMKNIITQKDWRVKGVFYECCAAEGQCPVRFGMDKEEPCKSFAVLEIKEGQINGVDMKGIVVIYINALLTSKFAEIPVKGAEGAVYISDNATKEQRSILEPFVKVNLLGSAFNIKKYLAVKFVPINVSKEDNAYHISMPFGEAKLLPTVGRDGNPIRIENINRPFTSYYQVWNAKYWRYNDLGKDWEYKNRSGVITNFEFRGE